MGKILVRVALTGVISYEDTWDRGEQVTADPLGMRCLRREWKWLARGSSRDREGCVGCSPGREDAEKVLGGRVVEPPGPERESVRLSALPGLQRLREALSQRNEGLRQDPSTSGNPPGLRAE